MIPSPGSPVGGGLRAALAIIAITLASSVAAQKIVWGPYLRDADGSRAEIAIKFDTPIQATAWTYDPVAQQLTPWRSKTRSRVHRIRIGNLEPGRWHYWAVQGGTTWADKPWSKTGLVRAFPDSFRLAVWGDNQIGKETFHRIVNAMLREGCTGFLGAGDYIQHGYAWEWDTELFDHLGPALRYFPASGARGNHDTVDYAERWSTAYKAMTWGPMRVVILDSNWNLATRKSLQPSGAQWTWLKREIASAAWQQALYRVVVYHHPHKTDAWDAGCNYGPNNLDAAMTAVFERLLVPGQASLVINGHAHAYQRGAKQATTWIITGGGGGYLDRSHCWSWPEISLVKPVYHFLVMEVNPRRLLIRALTPAQGEIDRVVVPARRLQ